MATNDGNVPTRIWELADEEQQRMAALWQVLDALEDPIGSAALDAIQRIPAISAMLDATADETRKESQVAALDLQRAALVDGDWKPHLDDLRARGELYGQVGLAFSEWVGLLTAMRAPVLDHLLAHYSGDELRDYLTALGRYIDIALAALGEGYIAGQGAGYSRLYEQAPDLYATIEATGGRILRVNATLVRELGFSREELLEMCLADLTTRSTTADAEHALGQLIEHFRVANARLKLRRNDGRRPLPVMMSAEALSQPGGPVHAQCAFRDITRLVRAEQAMEATNRELARSNTALDEFAYIASHDLKAPLRDIDNLSSWILEDSREHLPSHSLAHLHTLRGRVIRMESLLAELLAYSRAGRVRDLSVAVDLSKLIANAVQMAAVPKRFRIETPDAVPSLYGPAPPLELVLRNLISNAVRHHHKHVGTVTISVDEAPDHIAIAVRDDGPGIDPAMHDRIFGMFQTLRRRDEGGGTGVGLALVKKVVEAHSGTVSVESEPGRGSTFTVTWPRSWPPDGHEVEP